MMEKDCWLCGEKFDTTKKLKSHLASRIHAKMEVVCPWCTDKTTKYKRVWELRDHCNKHHNSILKEHRPDLLSEGNAYYLAIHPRCYRRVVKPTSFYSPSARILKSAMRAWLKTEKEHLRAVAEWAQGWREGTSYEGNPGDDDFEPIYSGDESRAGSSSSVSVDRDINNPDAWRITYVALVPRDITAEAEFKGETYRFNFADTLLASLTRKMTLIPSGGRPATGRTRHKLIGDSLTQRKELASKLLGIPGTFIQQIFRLDNMFIPSFLTPPPPAAPQTLPSLIVIPKKPVYKKFSPTKTSRSVSKLAKPSKSSKSSKSSKAKSTSRSDPQKQPPTASKSETTASKSAPTASQSEPTVSKSAPTASQSEPIVSKSAPTASQSAPTVSRPATPDFSISFSLPELTSTELVFSPVSSGTTTPSVLGTPPPAKRRRLQEPVPYVPSPAPPDAPQYIPTPKSLLATLSVEPHHESTRLVLSNKSPAERARELLRFGGMPLFPPARWGWNEEKTVRLPGSILTKEWPPKGWAQMNADQKKLAWEFGAFQYEQVSGNMTLPDRAELLDRYNMFGLPGTKPHAKTKDKCGALNKQRYYMYESLRLLATKEVTPNLSTTFMLDMLEKAGESRDKSTDHICEAMDRAGIPLRLDA